MARRSVKAANTARAVLIIASVLVLIISTAAVLRINLTTFRLMTTTANACNPSPSAAIIFDECGGISFSFKENVAVNPPTTSSTYYVAKLSCPTTPQAPAATSTVTECYYPTPWSTGQNNGFTAVTDNTVTTPVGMFFRQFQVNDASASCPVLPPPCNNIATWNVLMPNGVPVSAPGVANSGCEFAPYPSTICYPPKPDPYTVTVSLSGSGFVPVNASSKEGAAFPTWPNGSIVNPFPIPLTFTSTTSFTNATGTFQQVTTTSRTFFQTRFLFSMILTVPGTQGGIFGYQCGDSVVVAPGGCGSDMSNSNFQSGFSSLVNDLNSVSLLTNSMITVQVNIPAYWIRSPTDWYGGFGAWTALGQMSGNSGTCTTVTNSCTTGLADHAPLGIYTCSQASGCGAFQTAQNYAQVGTLTSAQICSIVASPAYCGLTSVGSGNVCGSGLPCTFYIPVNIASFGTQFSVGQVCAYNMLTACLTSNGATMVVPIIFDVIGSSPPVNLITVNPITSAAGTVTGKVLDGGSLGCTFGSCGGLGGVTVSDGPPCSSQGCSTIETTTGQDGSFSLGGLQSGGHTIYFTKVGYYTQQVGGISLSQGGSASTGTILMTPLQGAGNICLVPPVPSPVPGAAPLFGGICAPVWLVIALIILAGLSLLLLLGVTPAGQAAGTFASGIARRTSLRRR